MPQFLSPKVFGYKHDHTILINTNLYPAVQFSWSVFCRAVEAQKTRTESLQAIGDNLLTYPQCLVDKPYLNTVPFCKVRIFLSSSFIKYVYVFSI